MSETLREVVRQSAEWDRLSHEIEYDPLWPDGKPNPCIYCDEALAEGDEMCGHNEALLALVDRALLAATAPTPCAHSSSTGIDTTPINDPGKVWRCHDCDSTWTAPTPDPLTEALAEVGLPATASWRDLIEHHRANAALAAHMDRLATAPTPDEVGQVEGLVVVTAPCEHCDNCHRGKFGPNTDGEPCLWCRTCGCHLNEHPALSARTGAQA